MVKKKKTKTCLPLWEIQETQGWIPELGRSPEEGNGYALLYSCLENSMYRRVWRATVYRVAKSLTQLKGLSMPNGV